MKTSNSSAQVWIDGEQSSLSNLKEGDVARAAFDPSQQQFLNVSAVTPDEMRNDFNKARSDLRMARGSHDQSPNASSTGNSNMGSSNDGSSSTNPSTTGKNQ
jgi:hypothetical protein